jgi:predicted dehydrogenase
VARPRADETLPHPPHPRHFRGYWDYDGGGLGDMGQHYLDPVQYLLNKDDQAPISVEIDADPQDDDAIGTWRRIEFTYADGCKVILDGEDRDKEAAYLEGPKGKISMPASARTSRTCERKSTPCPIPPAAAHRLPRKRPHAEKIRAQRAERLLVLHHGQHGHHRPPPQQEPQVRFQDPRSTIPRPTR